MNRLGLLLLLALVVPVLLISTWRSGGEVKASDEGGEVGGPVVIELFTSQGCSSCPAADRLLRKLAAEPGYRGRVFPLAFHVDYWNYIGWTDPFSAEAWTRRQHDYGRALGLGTVYTPQLVVNGRADCVGSREGEVRREIGEALATPPAATVEVSVDGAGSGSLAVRVAARLADGAEVRRAEALVALYQDGLTTPVERGENARRTLENDRVVRILERAFSLPAEGAEGGAAGTEGTGEVVLTLDPAWDRSRLGIVAFVQDADSLAILGAAAAPVGMP